jgi:hypothetical protein
MGRETRTTWLPARQQLSSLAKVSDTMRLEGEIGVGVGIGIGVEESRCFDTDSDTDADPDVCFHTGAPVTYLRKTQ